jgi:hypothetical protein
MASETGQQQVIVESDFLFGLRKSDARHSKVIAALEMHREGRLRISPLSSAALEVRTVLYSRGVKSKGIEEAFTLMATILAEYGIDNTLPTNLNDVIVAERLRLEEPDLTFFDSLHAATSKRLGMILLSSEGAYQRLGLPVMDLDKLKSKP